MKVAIAGASGFIGRQLVDALKQKHNVVALSRQEPSAQTAGVELRRCDLFSLLEVERALDGADVGVYLVHSMMPPNRLTQGSFDDLDLLLADNFARAAKLKGLQRIIYLGGLIPKENLSRHLASRLEVERVLAAQGVPVVTLRAGLITGRGGSSFAIIEKLVYRLPLMVCPKWTSTRCQPVDLADVVAVLTCAVADASLPAGAYDIGGPNVLSYAAMMREVADAMGLKRRFLSVGVVSPRISRLWVSLVTGASKQLVYPLIESLRHDMVANGPSLFDRYKIVPATFREAVGDALKQRCELRKVAPAAGAKKREGAVTSVQRFPIGADHDVAWVASEYAAWLPRFLRPLIRVDVTPDRSLIFRSGPWHLLELTYSEARSSATRQLYYLTGGRLLRKDAGRAKSRLEFRQVPGRREVVAAILDYRPRLPWWFYRWTQAQIHLLVMYFFARHVRACARADFT